MKTGNSAITIFGILLLMILAGVVVAMCYMWYYKDLDRNLEAARTQAKAVAEQKKEQVATLEEKLTLLQKELRNKEQTLNQVSAELTEQRKNFAISKESISKAEGHTRLLTLLSKIFEGTPYEVYENGPYLAVRVPESSFAFSSSLPTVNLIHTLELMTEVINAYREDYFLIVEGHTDNVGIKEDAPIASNRELGAKRSLRVVNTLETFGARPDDVLVASWGEYMPVVEHQEPKPEARNRRIELVFAPRRTVKKMEIVDGRLQTVLEPSQEQNSAATPGEGEVSSSDAPSFQSGRPSLRN